jgi:hypothetical protein
MVAVPWSRAPTSREVRDAALRDSMPNTATRHAEGDDVAALIAAAPNATAAAAAAAAGLELESGIVSAGVMTSRWSLTREVRAFLTCLDPEVGFDAYFVAEDNAVDLHLDPAPNMQVGTDA